MKLIQISAGHPLWCATSLFIRTTYLEHYSARIASLPKNIIALVDGQNKLHCAAGLRDYSEPFFSENYLDVAIERVLSDHAGKTVERREIVEVSSLASRSPSASIQFMRELILYGEVLGFNWAFFTVTRRLEKLLHRIHLPLIDLGAADPARVPTPEIWGRYYESTPRVLAIGRDDLAPFLGAALQSRVCAGGAAHG